MKLIYTMAEVCEMFSVTRSTIDRWEAEKLFPSRVRPGIVRPTVNKRGVKKRSNCRIGFPMEEVDAHYKTLKDARTSPSKEGVTTPLTRG